MKKCLTEWLDTLILLLPVGWVITCYDGGWKYFLSGEYPRFLWHLFAGCIFSMFLLGVGMYLSGLTFEKDKDSHISINKWIVISIELFVLVIASYKLLG